MIGLHDIVGALSLTCRSHRIVLWLYSREELLERAFSYRISLQKYTYDCIDFPFFGITDSERTIPFAYFGHAPLRPPRWGSFFTSGDGLCENEIQLRTGS
jgi:hypothetical protein